MEPNPKLSIIIPTLNDNDELNKTIDSINNTTKDGDVEIIVIDDFSTSPVPYRPDVKLIRNYERLGAGASRHIGAKNAKCERLLLIDSHMRFIDGWLESAMTSMEGKKKTLWCSLCLGLNKDNMNPLKPNGVYSGAKLSFQKDKIFEGIWDSIKNEDNYEISCIMGANYFIHKSWFLYIGGLESNKMWGSEEPFISIKSWLSGGEVRLMTNVKIGHKFRDESPYITDIKYIIYNKIRPIKVLFPDYIYNILISYIHDDDNKLNALKMIDDDRVNIQKEKSYYESIFVKDINWLCDKFNIKKSW